MNISQNTINKLVDFIKAEIVLKDYKLDPEFFYNNLPLCVIDSVFSISVKYESVKNVVSNFCNYKKIQPYRVNQDSYPSKEEQYSITDYLNDFENLGGNFMAEKVFNNRHRTSPTNGILKAEAVNLFMKELRFSGINYFQDIDKVDKDLENRIKSIKGQGSGISLQYFFMLAGNDNFIKPDRMIVRFIERIVNERVKLCDCTYLLKQVSKELGLSPRLLDNAIWNYQRNQL